MIKALLLLTFLSLSTVAQGQSLDIQEIGYDDWRAWSTVEQTYFVAGMMQMEGHLLGYAQWLDDDYLVRFLDAFSITALSVQQVRDLITEWYRRNPEDHYMSLSVVYSMIALRQRELQSEQHGGKG